MSNTFNLLDNFIGVFSPTAALKRAQARFAIEQIRAYEGASKGPRNKNWKSSSGSANVETQSLPELRNRASDLARNNSYSSRALSVIPNNVVGLGIRPRVTKKKGSGEKVMKLWQDWAETTDCDFDGHHTMYGLQHLATRAVFERGNVIIRKRRRKDKIIPIQIQVVEGDLLDHNKTTTTAGGYILNGVEFNNDGRKVAYWIYDQHPSDIMYSTNSLVSKSVPASEIIHLYVKDRPGQTVGVPSGVSGFQKLRDFDDYEDAQLVRQKIAACFAVFVHDSAENLTGAIQGTETESDGTISERVQPGLIEHLPAGKTVTFAAPPGTSGYSEYAKNVLRSIAISHNITYEALTGDLSNVNFSSGRMGWLEFHRQVEQWQSNLVIPGFTRVWDWFLDAAVISGQLSSKNGLSPVWTPPRREMIDPVKEINALSIEVRNGFTSWRDAVSSRGWDPDDLLLELSQEQALFEKFKMMLECDPRYDPTRTNYTGTTPPDSLGSTLPAVKK